MFILREFFEEGMTVEAADIDFSALTGTNHIEFGDILIQWGNVYVGAIGDYQTKITNVTYPIPFGSVPATTITPDLPSTGIQVFQLGNTSTSSQTTTGFKAGLSSVSVYGSYSFDWIAIGKKA